MSGENEREATIDEERESAETVDSTPDDASEPTDDETAASTRDDGTDRSTDDETDEGIEESAASGEKDAIDMAAESFLEVEQAIDSMVEGAQVRGQAIDVERIPAHEVPDGFPYEIGTADALALTLELDETEGRTATTYFEWPDEGTGTRLGRLLALRDVSIDRFADLHGEDILLEVEDGHFVPVLPDEEPRGDDRAYYGVVAGFAVLLFPFIASLFGAFGLVEFSVFLLLYLLVHLVVLPVSTYLDAWHVRTTTNWEGGPLFWSFFSMLPGINVMTVAAYLVLRANAEPIS